MFKKIILIVLVFQLSACNELQQILENTGNVGLTNFQIANGLKEALQNGVTNQVTTLGGVDGFYKNELVKILVPQELQKVDRALRDIGLSNLADKGLKVLNRAAEDAVGEAIPIFKNAILDMTITDAKNILMGNQDAATRYLENSSSNALRGKFTPIIQNSFHKVGADKVWADVINTYNQIPFIQKVNPNLTEYTTNEAMKGVFKMVAVEEVKIRTNIKSRTSDLLRRVFSLQDTKN
ncbi:MAG TPA: DUF4197 domain-containing protein [Lutibacter sp.]|nr:DUF4197 domain-containing protein [Lutibacter sp.]